MSILIPTRNRTRYLGDTLATILAQTYEKVEVVVADDGSTDDTLPVLSKWSERFRQERGWALLVLQQAHKGVCAARNLAAGHCRGEMIKFFDDDDLMSHDLLAAQVRTLREADAEFVHGCRVPFFKCRRGYLLDEPEAVTCPDGGLLNSWLRGTWPGIWTCLMTRQFLRRVEPWAEDLPRNNDMEFLARCAVQSPRTRHCPQGVVYHRRHLKSISSSASLPKPECATRYMRILEEHLERTGAIESYRREMAKKFRGHAVLCYSGLAFRLGNLYARKAFQLEPDYVPKRGWLSRRLFSSGHYCAGLFLKAVKGSRRHLGVFRAAAGLPVSLKHYRLVNELPLAGPHLMPIYSASLPQLRV